MPRSSEQRGRRGLCRAPVLCLTCGVLWGLLCCLTGLPAARGAAAVGERHAGPDAALAEMTAAARLLAVLAPARSRPDDSEAQRAFIAAFPTDQAAFAAGMRLTGDAPLDWLLGLAVVRSASGRGQNGQQPGRRRHFRQGRVRSRMALSHGRQRLALPGFSGTGPLS